MANAGTQPTRRKSNMMERLRRLRSLPTLPPTTTAGQGRSFVLVPRRTTGAGDVDNRASSAAKNGPRHREQALDLEKLDSKLERYAQLRGRNGDGAVRGKAHEPARGSSDQVPEKRSSSTCDQGQGAREAQGTAGAPTSTEPEGDATACSAAATESQPRPQKEPIEIIVHPPEHEPTGEAGPSDYQVFLRRAEEDERLRRETGQPSSPKAKHEPQLNQFYSNDWPGTSPASPKLAGIQESGEEAGAQGAAAAAGDGEGKSVESDDASSFERQSGWQRGISSGNSGSHDFAGTPEAKVDTFAQANLVRPTPGRHVSFCEPVRTKARSDSYSSAYHVRGYESPQAPGPVTRRRSIRKMMTDYLRQF